MLHGVLSSHVDDFCWLDKEWFCYNVDEHIWKKFSISKEETETVIEWNHRQRVEVKFVQKTT